MDQKTESKVRETGQLSGQRSGLPGIWGSAGTQTGTKGTMALPSLRVPLNALQEALGQEESMKFKRHRITQETSLPDDHSRDKGNAEGGKFCTPYGAQGWGAHACCIWISEHPHPCTSSRPGVPPSSRVPMSCWRSSWGDLHSKPCPDQAVLCDLSWHPSLGQQEDQTGGPWRPQGPILDP